jgi:hypothetical protein
VGKIKHKKYLPRELFKNTTPCERYGVNSKVTDLRKVSKWGNCNLSHCPCGDGSRKGINARQGIKSNSTLLTV